MLLGTSSPSEIMIIPPLLLRQVYGTGSQTRAFQYVRYVSQIQPESTLLSLETTESWRSSLGFDWNDSSGSSSAAQWCETLTRSKSPPEQVFKYQRLRTPAVCVCVRGGR